MDGDPCNFEDFIDKVKDMNYDDIINYGDREVARMESLSDSKPGAVIAGDRESTKYTEQIKAFLYFMGKGMKPMGISEYDFKLYRIVVEYLVIKKQMKPEAIEIFISSK